MAVSTPTEIRAWAVTPNNGASSSFTVAGGSNNVVIAHFAVTWAAGAQPTAMTMSGGIGAGTLVAEDIQAFDGGMQVWSWFGVAGGSYTLTPSGGGTFDSGLQVVEMTGAASINGVQEENDQTPSENQSVTVTSATGDMTLCAMISAEATTGVSQTGLGAAANIESYFQRSQYGAGAATVALGFTGTLSVYNMIGYNVVASGGGASTWGPLLGLKNNRLVGN